MATQRKLLAEKVMTALDSGKTSDLAAVQSQAEIAQRATILFGLEFASVASELGVDVDEFKAPTATSLPSVVTATATQPPAPTTAPAALLDVTLWMGKTPQDFANQYGQPYVTDTIRALPDSESMPRGGVQHGYKTQWGLLDVGFTDGRAVRIELHIGDARPTSPTSWDDALRAVGLPPGARPAQSGPAGRRYPNVAGFVVQLNGSASKVTNIIVWRAR